MARQPRPDQPGGWHHVMNHGIRRFDVFTDAHQSVLGNATLSQLVQLVRSELTRRAA